MSDPIRMERVTMIDEGHVDSLVGDTASHRTAKQIVDEIRRLGTDRPCGTIFTAMGAGLVIGFLTSRR